jgi:tetratricopeptide (TPR) repeat protein
MPRLHPHDSGLRELLQGLEGASRRTLEHLLECAPCRQRALALLHARKSPLSARLGKLLRLPDTAPDYGRILDCKTRDICHRQLAFERERNRAAALLPELLSHAREGRELLLRNQPRYHTWGVFELLLDQSREESFHDPTTAEHLAGLALIQVDYLDPEHYGLPRIEDMRARAWSYVANARRIRSNLQDSEEGFRNAWRHLRQGTGDPLERALLLDLQASLRRAQRRFPEAVSLLRRAVQIFEEMGERHRAGRSLVNLATVHEQAGTPERAISLLYAAIRKIDPEQEPRLVLCARHNLITNLADAGRFLEAHHLFHATQPLYRQFPDAATQNRRKWVQGKIARGIGRLQEAEECFLAARDGFLTDRVAYDVALVSLELATLHAERGRAAEVKRLAQELAPVFWAHQIPRETLAAVTCFLQAAESEEVDQALVARVAAYLRRAQNDPELKFEEEPGGAGGYSPSSIPITW